MQEYKYKIGGCKYNPQTGESIVGGTFSTNFGNASTNDAAAIAEADKIFCDKSKAARSGEAVGMTLWENGRVVKNYEPIKKGLGS